VPNAAFLAFHESFSDLVAALTALRFRSVAARLLAQTGGNLYALNLVSRFGELSDLDQARLLDNRVRMADVAGLRLLPDGGWADSSGQGGGEHQLAAPLTGAIWDSFVEVFQDGLLARDAITPAADPRGWDEASVARSLAFLGEATDAARARFGDAFLAALVEARERVARAMAHVMRTLTADMVSFEAVAATFLEGLAAPPALAAAPAEAIAARRLLRHADRLPG
jgi:hypothetical protein